MLTYDEIVVQGVENGETVTLFAGTWEPERSVKALIEKIDRTTFWHPTTVHLFLGGREVGSTTADKIRRGISPI